MLPATRHDAEDASVLRREGLPPAEGFSADELGDAHVRLAELDLALKGGSGLAPDVELQRALIVSRGARADER